MIVDSKVLALTAVFFEDALQLALGHLVPCTMAEATQRCL